MAASSDVMLQPGVQIRPETTHEDVEDLARRLYNFDNITITDINSYDDKNYLIKVNASENCADVWVHGYVMKIMNTLDSKNLPFLEAQDQMMIHLGSKKIQCTQPVLNVKGLYYSLEKIYEKGDSSGSYKEHVVRLLTYQPGKILHQVPCTNELFYQAGRYVATLDVILKDFHHPAYNTHKKLWMLSSSPMLRDFQYAVKDQLHYKMVTDVLESFDREVIPQIPDLEKGIIHGDFNEQNILTREIVDEQGWEISGIIDFGDSQYNCYVFELAIAICYMMIQAKLQDPLDVGGHVIAGYKSVRSVTEQEFHLLKVCVSARFCQSLVMGAYSYLQDPSNEYILTTQSAGWKILTSLMNTPQEVLEKRWKRIIATYN